MEGVIDKFSRDVYTEVFFSIANIFVTLFPVFI